MSVALIDAALFAASKQSWHVIVSSRVEFTWKDAEQIHAAKFGSGEALLQLCPRLASTPLPLRPRDAVTDTPDRSQLA